MMKLLVFPINLEIELFCWGMIKCNFGKKGFTGQFWRPFYNFENWQNYYYRLKTWSSVIAIWVVGGYEKLHFGHKSWHRIKNKYIRYAWMLLYWFTNKTALLFIQWLVDKEDHTFNIFWKKDVVTFWVHQFTFGNPTQSYGSKSLL